MRRLLLLLIPALLLIGVVALGRATANQTAALTAQPGDLIYVATFDAFLDDWQLYDDGQLAAQVESTALHLTVNTFESIPFSVTAPTFGDFDLRVRTRALAGPLNNGYGVIFRLQDEQRRRGATWGDLIANQVDDLVYGEPDARGYYMFLVSSDGYYQVRREVEGVQRELSTWIPSPIVNQGFAEPNDLRVVARGDEFQFYVNDMLMPLCIPDDSQARSTYNELTGECLGGSMRETLVDDALPVGRLGVVAQSFNEAGVVVSFDDVVVQQPQ